MAPTEKPELRRVRKGVTERYCSSRHWVQQTEKYFNRNKNTISGFQNICRECQSKRNKSNEKHKTCMNVSPAIPFGAVWIVSDPEILLNYYLQTG